MTTTRTKPVIRVYYLPSAIELDIANAVMPQQPAELLDYSTVHPVPTGPGIRFTARSHRCMNA
jgi:hypothetical protein